MIQTWVVLSDLQIPFQDKPVLDLVFKFMRDLRPYGVVLNGDVVDCYELSEFDKNPLKDAGLDREIREAGNVMDQIKDMGVKRRVWLGGNHEDRLRRVLWKNPKFARIAALQFPKLFDLDKYGFEWRPYGAVLNLGRLVVTHGSTVRQHSGWTARAHFEKFGGSVLVGHTHRLGTYYRSNARGMHASFENGCLCRLNPEYVQFPDWQQGFSVVHVDTENTGFFSVQQIPIIRRRMLFYGQRRFERGRAVGRD